MSLYHLLPEASWTWCQGVRCPPVGDLMTPSQQGPLLVQHRPEDVTLSWLDPKLPNSSACPFPHLATDPKIAVNTWPDKSCSDSVVVFLLLMPIVNIVYSSELSQLVTHARTGYKAFYMTCHFSLNTLTLNTQAWVWNCLSREDVSAWSRRGLKEKTDPFWRA